MASEKENKSIDSLIKELSKKYANNSLAMKASVVPTFKRIPSKALGLSYVTYGGFAEGTIDEISGEEHSGKTSVACLMIADCQRKYPDKICVYIDIECLLDVQFQAFQNGIDLDRLYYVKPTMMSGEQICDMAVDFLKNPQVGVVVLDSLPAMVPQIVWESDLVDDKGMRASMARKLHLFLPMAKSIVSENSSQLVLINQTRDEQKNFGGKTLIVKKETCGSAAKFYSDTIIRCGKRTFTLEDEMDYCGKGKDAGEGADGYRIKFKIIKNKTAKVARGGGFITYRYATGIDYLHDALEIAITFGFIQKLTANGRYALVNLNTGEVFVDENGEEIKGYKAYILNYLYNHKDFCDAYINDLTKHITESNDSYGVLIDTSDIDAEQASIDANEVNE